MLQARIAKMEGEIERVTKSGQNAQEKVRLAEVKVDKYVWLGKKHGLNF